MAFYKTASPFQYFQVLAIPFNSMPLYPKAYSLLNILNRQKNNPVSAHSDRRNPNKIEPGGPVCAYILNFRLIFLTL